MSPAQRRRLEILTPAGVTLFAVLTAVLASPMIDSIGWLARPCSLRSATGLPCLACGGTRAVQAMATGQWLVALKFNPLVVVGVWAAVIWFVAAVWRAWRWRPCDSVSRTSGKGRLGLILTAWGLAAVVNWIYLWKYLPV